MTIGTSARVTGPGIKLLAVALLLGGLAAHLSSAPGRDWLADGFQNPPPEARLRCYWWWLNGNTTADTITRDLEEMKAKGYGGALLVDAGGADQQGNHAVPAGPMFASPAWRALYRHAIAEAARLGLEISLNIQSGWNLGGPMVTPEQSAKLLTWSKVEVTGPADYSATLETPPSKLGFYRDIAVLAYPLHHPGSHRPIKMLAFKNASRELGMSMPPTEPLLEDGPAEPNEEDARVAEVEDLSARMTSSGRFEWRVPDGRWEILRVGYTSSGAMVSTSRARGPRRVGHSSRIGRPARRAHRRSGIAGSRHVSANRILGAIQPAPHPRRRAFLRQGSRQRGAHLRQDAGRRRRHDVDQSPVGRIHLERFEAELRPGAPQPGVKLTAQGPSTRRGANRGAIAA